MNKIIEHIFSKEATQITHKQLEKINTLLLLKKYK